MLRQKYRKISIEIKKKYKLNNIQIHYIYKYKHTEEVRPDGSNNIK